MAEEQNTQTAEAKAEPSADLEQLQTQLTQLETQRAAYETQVVTLKGNLAQAVGKLPHQAAGRVP